MTISLLVLITILGMGFLSLSAIAQRQSRANSHLATAQANARLALVIAIGQLQKHAGDDRRITMAADQISDEDDGATTSAIEGRRHWTGVYRSWNVSRDARPKPEFLAWLVSSPGPGSLGEDAPTDNNSSAASVELVGAGTIGESTPGRVRVPLISTDNGGGRLAWWTGDQGLKAMLALPEAGAAPDLAGVRSALQSAPVNGVALASAGTTTPFADTDFSAVTIDALTSWPQTAFLSATPQEPMPLFHDLAVRSSGLLTNVRAGGFRRDLSMELERDNRAIPVRPLYTIGSEPGINLEELWVYYNLYKDLRTRSGRYTTGGSIPSRTSSLALATNADACKLDDYHHLKMPVIVSYQMVFSLETRPMVVNGQTVNRLRIVADPILTFWNPLDVPVVIPTTAFLSIKYWIIPYDLRISTRTGTKRCPLLMALSGGDANTNSDQNYLTLRCGEMEQLVFKPGEVIKVSQSGNTIVRDSNSTDHNLQGRSGFNYGGGRSLPVRDESGAFIDLAGNETISYEFVPNNLTSGATSRSGRSVSGGSAHSRHFSLNHHEYYVGTDRGSNSLGIGGMYIDWDFGNQRLKRGENRGTPEPGPAGTKPPGERLYASNFPQVFPTFGASSGRPLSASELGARKAPVLLVSYNAKTEQGTRLNTRSLARFNPRCHHVDFYDLSQKERDMLPYEFKIEPLVSWKIRELEVSPNGNAFFGGGLDAATGVNFVATHSVPREPLASLAALQHSFANGFVIQKPVHGYAILNGREPLLPQISHAIGNSMAPAILEPDRTQSTISGKRPVADHSYLANRALFDDWFFSSIAPQTTTDYAAPRTHRVVAEDFLKGDKPLANSRYLPNTRGRDVAALLGRLFRGTKVSTEATDLVASLLRVDGMFNVNSTSVEAWKAVLSGLNELPVATRSETGATTITPNEEGIPVAGLLAPTDIRADDSAGVKDQGQWTGRRVLDKEEIDALARAIVREVRKRGPFLSLADFVNRRVGSDKDLAKSGVIQSALDSDDVPINEAYRDGYRSVPEATSSRFAFAQAEEGPVSQGIPGIVKQADILTPIAPVLSARSDSFIIRAYGEALDPKGTVLAKAWCEAVVERDSSFLTGADPPETLPDKLSNQVDKAFGRAFRLVSFRWLAPADA